MSEDFSDRSGGDRPPGDRFRDDRGPGGPPRDDRGPGGGFGRPGGPRGPGGPRYRDDGPRPEPSVKARLRAKARKKARKQKKKMFQRRKVCRFCADKRLPLGYKEPKTLRLFISETGKVTPRRISGNCSKHQRQLAVAIKRARQLAFLPFAPSHF